MLTEDNKLAVKSFYASQVEQMAGGEYLRNFLLNYSIGYIQLGDERGYVEWEEYSTSQGKSAIRVKNVTVKQIEENDVPESLLKAFQRYIWCSRYSLSDVRVVKFFIGEVVTYAIYNEAYVDDGWDGELNSWEIYDSEGDLVGSLIFFNSAWQFQEEEIDPSDFLPPAPPYIPDVDQRAIEPFWSAENAQWLLPIWYEAIES